MPAKTVEISDDAGSNWYVLPGGTGDLNVEGEGITDTIFGSTYQSNLAGLITWMINANALYKGFAGYLAKLKQPGTSTTVNGDPFTSVSGNTYQITDSAKQIWDRTGTFTFYEDAVAIPDSDVESIDYLFGKVTFATSKSGTITGDVAYFSASPAFGKGNSYTLTMTAETIDESNFPDCQSNGGYRIFSPGLRTVSLELGGIFDASINAKDILAQRSEIIVEIDPAGDGKSIARGFFRVTSAPQSGDVGALEEQTINLTLNVPDDDKMEHAFSWEHANDTSLSTAVQKMITAWLNEDDTIQGRYLPQGATGQSPLDGVKGTVMMTDISLSGGLSDMNTFQASMQGIGAYTEV